MDTSFDRTRFEEEIKKAVSTLRAGGIIVYPTDTIWGIGCDATDPSAVKKVYEIKRRAESKALLVLVDSVAKVEFYVRELPDVAYDLIEVSDKPLTVIYDGARNLAPNLLADDGSVGIRVTRERFSAELCRRFGKAIVSTSANIAGEPSPRLYSEISPEILAAADCVVDFRRDDTAPSAPSSIIRLGAGGQVKIIR